MLNMEIEVQHGSIWSFWEDSVRGCIGMGWQILNHHNVRRAYKRGGFQIKK